MRFSRSVPRSIAAAGGVATAAVILLILLVPLTSGSLSGATNSPQFSGATVVTSEKGYRSLCGNYTSVHSPAVNLLHGTVTFEEKASMSRCLTFRAASIQMTAGLLGRPFLANSTGIHNVSYRWQVGWSWTLGGILGMRTAVIKVLGNVFDTTSHAWVLASNATLVVFQGPCCVPGPASFRYNETLNFTVPLTLGHQYRFYTSVLANATVYARCHIGCISSTGWFGIDMYHYGYLSHIRSMKLS